MSRKKPKGSLFGAVVCGSITAFFLLMAFAPLGAGDALVPMFTLLFAFFFGIGFLVFFLTWVLKMRKYEKEKSHREMMARRRVEKWRREQQRENDPEFSIGSLAAKAPEKGLGYVMWRIAEVRW